MSLFNLILSPFRRLSPLFVFRASVVLWLSFVGHAESATVQAPPTIVEGSATFKNETPAQVLNRVTTPFIETRSDPDNWSTKELEAYKIQTREAFQQCATLEKAPYEGEELFALATLCQTGFNWPGAYSAAFRYTRQSAPHSKEAYAILLQSAAALGDSRNEVSHAVELASKFPFDADVNSMLSFAVDFLEILYPKDDTEVALLRQKFLLPVLLGETSLLNYDVALKEAWQTLMILRVEKLTQDEHAQRLLLEEALLRCKGPNCLGASPQADRYREQLELQGKTIVGKVLPVSKQHAHGPTGTVWIFTGSSAPMMRKFKRSLTSDNQLGRPKYTVKLVPHFPLTANPHLLLSLAPGTVDLIGIDQLLTPQSPPFFVVVDAAHTILFAGTGNISWLRPEHQIDMVLANDKKVITP